MKNITGKWLKLVSSSQGYTNLCVLNQIFFDLKPTLHRFAMNYKKCNE